MILPILLGVLFGALAMVPLWASTFLVKRVPATNTMGLLLVFVLAIAVSMAILIVALLVCNGIADEEVIPFAIAEVAAFFVGVIVFAITRMVRK